MAGRGRAHVSSQHPQNNNPHVGCSKITPCANGYTMPIRMAPTQRALLVCIRVVDQLLEGWHHRANASLKAAVRISAGWALERPLDIRNDLSVFRLPRSGYDAHTASSERTPGSPAVRSWEYTGAFEKDFCCSGYQLADIDS